MTHQWQMATPTQRRLQCWFHGRSSVGQRLVVSVIHVKGKRMVCLTITRPSAMCTQQSPLTKRMKQQVMCHWKVLLKIFLLTCHRRLFPFLVVGLLLVLCRLSEICMKSEICMRSQRFAQHKSPSVMPKISYSCYDFVSAIMVGLSHSQKSPRVNLA